MITATYLSSVFSKTEQRDELFRKFHKCLLRLNADHIIVTGLSGVIFAVAFNQYCGFPYVVVRKDDGTHSDEIVEGASIKYQRGVIVDDLISTGKTVQTIVKRYDSYRTSRALFADDNWFNYKVLNFVLLYSEDMHSYSDFNFLQIDKNRYDVDIERAVDAFLKKESYLEASNV